MVTCLNLKLRMSGQEKKMSDLKKLLNTKKVQAVHGNNTEQGQGLWGRTRGQGAGSALFLWGFPLPV